MEEWKEYKLGEISTFSQGIQVDIDKQYSDYKPGRVRFIRIVDFTRNDEPIRFIDKPRDKCLTEDGDIVMIRYGSQTAGLVAISYDGAIANNIFKITFNNAVVSNEFGYYYLSQKSIFDFLRGAQSSSTMPAITFEIASRVPLFLPPIKEQERITKILKSLDDKIEVNRRINENLEQQAQALFKSWFVDFEPFKDQPFVESELGMIPQGWKVGSLNEIADVIMGTSPSGTSYNIEGKGDVFYQGRAEFGFRFPKRNLYTTEAKRFADVDSVLVSVRAPVGDINVAEERCCIGRGLASVKSNKGCNSFILYLMQSLKPVFDRFNGEGTVFGSINKKAFEDLKVVIPDEKNVFEFDSISSSIDSQIKRTVQESRRLAELRDTLLPRLMSGEIKVNDVDV